VELQINSQAVTIDAAPDLPLLWVLRDLLGMTGTKFGCGMALCGACTVLIDGQAVRSCVLPVAQAAGKAITTIEGIGATPVGAALQGAWLDMNVPQCGYCQAGQIMSAAAPVSYTHLDVYKRQCISTYPSQAGYSRASAYRTLPISTGSGPPAIIRPALWGQSPRRTPLPRCAIFVSMNWRADAIHGHLKW